MSHKEAAPHLILMAFLQRVLNGGGQILREFAAGSGRVDLCVIHDGKRYPIELKIRRNTKTQAEGVEQTLQYMDTLGCVEGWLVVFDQRIRVKWADRLYMRKKTTAGKTVTVVGL